MSKASYDSAPETWAHIHEVGKLLHSVVIRLLCRVVEHDQSKFSKAEKPHFDKWTPELKATTYGSDEYRRALDQLGPALKHHYRANKHHPEHYRDGIEGMSLLDLVEMLADWKAAGKRHADGSLEQSLAVNVERFKIGPQLESILRNTAREMCW